MYKDYSRLQRWQSKFLPSSSKITLKSQRHWSNENKMYSTTDFYGRNENFKKPMKQKQDEKFPDTYNTIYIPLSQYLETQCPIL